MEREKNNYSDNTSTAESEAEKPNEERAARSYDCGFCKRGFTNAQALGGHMNIHRKDKANAKANKKKHEDPFIQSFNSNHSFTFPDQIAAADYDHVFRGHVGGYQVSNPALQTRNYEYCFFPDNLEDRVDRDLGLMIEDEEDVDLELRLG